MRRIKLAIHSIIFGSYFSYRRDRSFYFFRLLFSNKSSTKVSSSSPKYKYVSTLSAIRLLWMWCKRKVWSEAGTRDGVRHSREENETSKMSCIDFAHRTFSKNPFRWSLYQAPSLVRNRLTCQYWTRHEYWRTEREM